jgi:hypothetical protein
MISSIFIGPYCGIFHHLLFPSSSSLKQEIQIIQIHRFSPFGRTFGRGSENKQEKDEPFKQTIE